MRRKKPVRYKTAEVQGLVNLVVIRISWHRPHKKNITTWKKTRLSRHGLVCVSTPLRSHISSPSLGDPCSRISCPISVSLRLIAMPPKAGPKVDQKDFDRSLVKPGTIVLYRLRGYPPWPSIVRALPSLPSLPSPPSPCPRHSPARTLLC